MYEKLCLHAAQYDCFPDHLQYLKSLLKSGDRWLLFCLSTPCLEKSGTLDFDHNLCKCRPNFKLGVLNWGGDRQWGRAGLEVNV